MLMGDVCDIKDLSGAYDWDGVKDIYESGEYAEKSDGSYRTLDAFASASGKNHAYDTYYGEAGSWDLFVSAAIEGTGAFAGESDTVRDQVVEKGIQNGIMTAYAIHELNAAIIKAEAGNWGPDDAQHAWDEGWAFYHGPDDSGADFDGCGPYATADKRAGNFGTDNADGTAAANVATLAAMNAGLTAMQNEDMQGLVDARDEVLKNIVIVYSQASVRYASKMTDDLATGDADDYDKHQAEGHAFFRVIEAYVHATTTRPMAWHTSEQALRQHATPSHGRSTKAKATTCATTQSCTWYTLRQQLRKYATDSPPCSPEAECRATTQTTARLRSSISSI